MRGGGGGEKGRGGGRGGGGGGGGEGKGRGETAQAVTKDSSGSDSVPRMVVFCLFMYSICLKVNEVK